jgi:hypothetical protein
VRVAVEALPELADRRVRGRMPRGRPHCASIACSTASTSGSRASVSKPTTRFTKSSPSKPTAVFAYACETTSPGNAARSAAIARRRFATGSTLLPAAT